MITIGFADSTKWPLLVSISAYKAPVDCSDIKTVTLEGDALAIAAMEFAGLPMPKYANEWQDEKVTWYWTDAQFIAANLAKAYEVNKDAVRIVKK